MRSRDASEFESDESRHVVEGTGQGLSARVRMPVLKITGHLKHSARLENVQKLITLTVGIEYLR